MDALQAPASDPFEPKGSISLREACLVVFREMQPGQWVSYADLQHAIGELAEVGPVDLQSAQGAAWRARETLALHGEVGVEPHMGGYKKLEPQGQYEAAVKRARKTGRAARRTMRWNAAARANPELPAPERAALEEMHRVGVAQRELESRREKRQRPA